jgi:MFS family permease
LAATPEPNNYDAQANFEGGKGLGDLKNGFLLYLVAAVLGFVPFIGAVSGILILVALILLIIGWRALGRSSLKGKDNYGSTGRWLVYAIILVIVIGIIGVIVIAASGFFYFVSHPYTPPTTTSPGTLPPLSQIPGLTQILLEIFGLIVLLIAIWDGTWIKMCNSMRKLGDELSEPRLKTAGILYTLYILLGIGTGVAVVLIIIYWSTFSSFSPSALSRFSSATSLAGVFGYLALGGYFDLLGVFAILGNLVLAVGSYLGYSATSSAARKYASSLPSPPPPHLTLPTGGSFCPNCGHAISSVNNFCPSCGFRLK